MIVRKIKPCLFVNIRTRVVGGVEYFRDNIEVLEDSVRLVEKCDQTKIVNDQDEFKKAQACRNAARHMVAKLCTPINVVTGLICDPDRREEIEAANEEAKELVRVWNTQATWSFIKFNVQILQPASQAAAAADIRDEILELLGKMEENIASLDVKKIREAANKAKDSIGLLDKMQAERVLASVNEARAMATKINRLQKAGEDAEKILEQVQIEELQNARFSFLDTEDHEALRVVPAGPVQRFANVGDEVDAEVDRMTIKRPKLEKFIEIVEDDDQSDFTKKYLNDILGDIRKLDI